MKYELDSIDESVVTLDTYNSDLNLVIDASKYGAKPLTKEGFAFMWAGARATHGVVKGKICYEVKVIEYLDVSHLPADEPNPHVVRVGFSVDSSTMQLGEDPLSYGYGGTGKISTNCQFRNYGPPFKAGDCVLAAVDMESDPIQIGFSKNGNFIGWAYKVKKSELQGKALFPHILTKNCSFEVNFGQRQEPYFKFTESLKDFTFIGCLPLEERVGGTRPPEKREDCEMIMMCGLPGAGKSVWAADYSAKNPDKKYNVLGTNNIIDKMKVMGLPRKRNYRGRWDVLIQMATKCLNSMFAIGSKLRRNYILDQTNVYPTAQRRKMRNFDGFKRIAVVVVPTEAEYKRRCDKRDREEGKEIPDGVVLDMKANFKLPEVNDVFDDVIFTESQRDEAEKLVKAYNEEGKAASGPARKQFRANEPDKGFETRKGSSGSARNDMPERGRSNFGNLQDDQGTRAFSGYSGGRTGNYTALGGGTFYGDRSPDYGRRGINARRGIVDHKNAFRDRSNIDEQACDKEVITYGGGQSNFVSFQSERRNFESNRGAGRGGYDGNRGGGYDRGYGSARGGFDGGYGSARGGFDGGYGSARGGFDGGYGSARGGFDGGRGSARGGYDGIHGGGRGGYTGNRGVRGGYDGNRGSSRGGYDSSGGNRGSYDSSGGNRSNYINCGGNRSSYDSYGANRSNYDSCGSSRDNYGGGRGDSYDIRTDNMYDIYRTSGRGVSSGNDNMLYDNNRRYDMSSQSGQAEAMYRGNYSVCPSIPGGTRRSDYGYSDYSSESTAEKNADQRYGNNSPSDYKRGSSNTRFQQANRGAGTHGASQGSLSSDIYSRDSYSSGTISAVAQGSYTDNMNSGYLTKSYSHNDAESSDNYSTQSTCGSVSIKSEPIDYDEQSADTAIKYTQGSRYSGTQSRTGWSSDTSQTAATSVTSYSAQSSQSYAYPKSGQTAGAGYEYRQAPTVNTATQPWPGSNVTTGSTPATYGTTQTQWMQYGQQAPNQYYSQ